MTAIVNLESLEGASYEHALLIRVIGTISTGDNSESRREWSEVRMSEPTARRLHKVLGNIIRNLDQYDSESGRPND